MMARLRSRWHAWRCKRGVHAWSFWFVYTRVNVEAWAYEIGQCRLCDHCSEKQYRHVFYDAIVISTWEARPWNE